MDRGTDSASQRAHRAAVRDPGGLPGEGNALGRNRHHRSGESFLGAALIPEWGRRFTVTPRNPRNADRRLERDDCLDQILSVRVPHNLAFRGEIEEAQYLSEVSFYSFCQHPLSGLKASGPSPVRWAWRTSMHRRERSIVPDSDQQLSAHPSTS